MDGVAAKRFSMRPRTAALLLCALALVVAGYLANRALELIQVGTATSVLLGIGVLMLVLVGALLIAGEVRFGIDSERLAHRLHAEGIDSAPSASLERLPSGRLTQPAADSLFAERKLDVEAAPESWRAWWRLAAAYGEARDTPRGRRAMRKAIALERADPPRR